MNDVTQRIQRPTSPHIQVYRLPLTALFSITHRITGAALSIGMILITWFLFAASSGEESYNIAIEIITSPLGRIILFLWSLAIFFHTFTGIRHLIWDAGFMLDKDVAMRSNYYVLAATIITTLGVWAFACPVLSKLGGV